VATARVTSKGQITIPKEVRDQLGVVPGDILEFITTGREWRVKKRRKSESPFAPFRGIAKARFEALGYKTTDEYIEDVRGR